MLHFFRLVNFCIALNISILENLAERFTLGFLIQIWIEMSKATLMVLSHKSCLGQIF